jgi:hypothetical protein
MIAADIEHSLLNFAYQIVESSDGEGFHVRWGLTLVQGDFEPQIYTSIVEALRAVCGLMERNLDNGSMDRSVSMTTCRPAGSWTAQ